MNITKQYTEDDATHIAAEAFAYAGDIAGAKHAYAVAYAKHVEHNFKTMRIVYNHPVYFYDWVQWFICDWRK